MHAVTDRVPSPTVLSDMTMSMREIGESIGKIPRIIKSIDEIALPTNLFGRFNAARMEDGARR